MRLNSGIRSGDYLTAKVPYNNMYTWIKKDPFVPENSIVGEKMLFKPEA